MSAVSVDVAARRARAGLPRSASLPRHAQLLREQRRAPAVAGSDVAPPPSLLPYLPVALLVTASVVILPVALVAATVPRGGVVLTLASVALVVAISLALAGGEAGLWKRCPGSRDVVFADLMLWGWAHRRWTERRLARVRALYDSARRAGPTVSIELLTTLTGLLEARDAYTHGHSQRVARQAERIARALRLDPVQTAKIRTAAAVHDVGKLYTPRSILNNPRRLSQAEFEVMRRHATDGADMLAAVGDPEIAAMVRHHHERVDGSGYPDGLAGSAIPLGSRIIAVADTFDSITSNRPYRRADTQKRALDILSREADRQLDGDAVSAFRHRYSARASVAGWAFVAAALQRVLAGLQAGTAGLGTVAGGIGSLLPAFAAAGLLAVSPGLHRHTLGAQGTRATGAQAGQLAAPAPGRAIGAIGGTTGERAARGRVGTGPGNGRRGIAPGSSTSPVPTGSAPVGTSAPVGGASPEGGASGSGGSSLPSGPPSSSPGGGAHGGAGGAPPAQALPVTPPVTPPGVPVPSTSTPGASTPSVSTPTVTTPAIPIPGITVPSVNVQGTTVPSVSAPGVAVSGAATTPGK